MEIQPYLCLMSYQTPPPHLILANGFRHITFKSSLTKLLTLWWAHLLSPHPLLSVPILLQGPFLDWLDKRIRLLELVEQVCVTRQACLLFD